MKKILASICVLTQITLTVSAQWTKVQSGTSSKLLDVHFPTKNVGYIIGEFGLVLKSTDQGKSWQKIYQDSTKEFASLHFTDESTGYAVSINSIYKTLNGGLLWTEVYRDTLEYFKEVNFFNSTHGYIGSEFGIYKTTNAGLSWEKYLTNQPTVSISLPSDSIAYFAGSPDQSGHLIKTSNAGVTYDKYALPFQSIKEKIQFLNDSVGYVCGWYSGYVAKTINGGKNWQSINSSCECQCWELHFIDETFGYYIDNGGGRYKIFYTKDGGFTWELQLEVVENDYLNELIFLDKTTAIAVGDNGKIYRTENGGVGISETDNIQIQNVYPNPTNEFVIINLTNPIGQKLEVFNLYGQSVLEVRPSSSKLKIDFSQFDKGIYLLSFTDANGQKATKKIVKN